MAIRDIEPGELVEKTAEELKKIEQIKPPKWSVFVKTSVHKERPPVRTDWWYIRAASVLRTLYKLGPVGVSKLRTRYGGKKRRGHKPEEFRKASGNILRKILQQLENAGLAKQVERGVHRGRVITPKGRSLLDSVTNTVIKPIQKAKVREEIEGTEKREKIAKKKLAEEKISEKEEKEIAKEKIPSVEELVEQTKKQFKEKRPTAEELVEEAEGKDKRQKKIEGVPSAHELAKRKEKRK